MDGETFCTSGMEENREPNNNFSNFIHLLHSPSSHIWCQYFLASTSSTTLIVDISHFHYNNFCSLFPVFYLPFQFHQLACQSCICSIIQNYIFLSSSDKGKITARWCSTRDWAVKLECQAGINLAAYVHINTLIICSKKEGHVVRSSPTDIQKGHKVKASVCTGKYCSHRACRQSSLSRARATQSKDDPVHFLTPTLIFTSCL